MTGLDDALARLEGVITAMPAELQAELAALNPRPPAPEATLDDARADVIDAVRSLSPAARRAFVRMIFSAEGPALPPEIVRFLDHVAAVVAAGDTEAKEGP